MNCFSACKDAVGRWLLPLVIALIGGCGVPESESASRGDSGEYAVHYIIEPTPAAATARVTMRLRQGRALLRELSFAAEGIVGTIDGDGNIERTAQRVTWQPPANGGALEWEIEIAHERSNGGFDAFLNADWGVFRMEDAIPRARARTLKGAVSRTTFAVELPRGWSFVSEYSALKRPIVVDRPERRFDQPTGWVAVGKLGVRRDTIAGTRVAVAAPEGHNVRRLEMLALLNWTLPELNEVLPGALPRLTVVSAGEPMWRGGLSAPASLFLHADRPLISENATSPLLHEVMHVALGMRPRDGYDWIAEGLAEYYGIELLRRGRAITPRRADAALERQAEWALQADNLCGRTSTAATTARAVTLFAALDRELVSRSDNATGLDELLPVLTDSRPDLEMLVAAVTHLVGETPDVLHIDNLPGCRTIAADDPEN